jgi:hypothetical protein
LRQKTIATPTGPTPSATPTLNKTPIAVRTTKMATPTMTPRVATRRQTRLLKAAVTALQCRSWRRRQSSYR